MNFRNLIIWIFKLINGNVVSINRVDILILTKKD